MKLRAKSGRSGRLRPAGGAAIAVTARPGRPREGWLRAGNMRVPVALGRSGIHPDKREGDGRTPAGVWHVETVRYRPDHGARPRGAVPATPISPQDGWCDDAASGRYNRAVRLPFRPSHERMWRDDGLYDLVVVLDHNQRPRVTKRGSAVFVHIARPGFTPTEGCIALRAGDLRRLIARLRPGTPIRVG